MSEKIKFIIRTNLFMKYINNNELNYKDKIKFSDIYDIINNEIDINIYSWYNLQMYENFDAFKLECDKYKNIYSKAYNKMQDKFNKKLSRLSYSDRIRCIIEYASNNKIPSMRHNTRFCDLKEGIKDTRNVGSFIQDNICNNKSKFKIECDKYKDIYPKGYNQIINRINLEKYSNEERLTLFMKYINQDNIYIMYKDKTKFKDIDNTKNDNTIIIKWAYDNFDYINNNIDKYKREYREAFIKYNLYAKNIYLKHQTESLTIDERIKFYIKYLNNNEKEIVKYGSKLKFSDIDENIKDNTLVLTWMNNSLFNNKEYLINAANKYKDKYPIGYNKIINKINSYKIELPFEEKVELFMKYIDNENINIPNYKEKYTFKDIDSRIMDNSIVNIWFRATLSYRLPRLIDSIDKYKDIYPNAYLKICNSINNSNVRIKKERKLFIEELKKLRDNLTSKETIKIKKKAK